VLGGIAALYSIIHIPTDRLPGLLDPRAQLVGEPDDDGVEKARRAYLLARRPAGASS
jgi:hypothetical protein